MIVLPRSLISPIGWLPSCGTGLPVSRSVTVTAVEGGEGHALSGHALVTALVGEVGPVGLGEAGGGGAVAFRGAVEEGHPEPISSIVRMIVDDGAAPPNAQRTVCENRGVRVRVRGRSSTARWARRTDASPRAPR